MVHKFDKIRRINKDEGSTFKDDEIVYIPEKIDGCFDYGMKVQTDKGMIAIGRIVNGKMDVKALSMDENGNKSFKPITQYYKHTPSDNWVKLKYDYFGKERYLIVTDNHNVFTNNGIKQVKDLNHNDKLISNKINLNDTQKSILFGSILGDGSFRNMNKSCNPMFSETHSIKQEKYLKWKKDILGELCDYEEYYKSQYSKEYNFTEKYRIHSKSNEVFKEFEFMYKNGKKKIPNVGVEEYLTPLALAVWFMDDGSTGFSDTQKPRAKFHTQGFTEHEVFILREVLLHKYNIESTQHNYKGWQIDLTKNGTKKLFEIINDYIIDSMKYKIPIEYHKEILSLDCEILPKVCKIISIKKINNKKSPRYDLEVADNHNYFVKGVQVHNSNFRVWRDENNELRFGSRTVEFLPESDPNCSYGNFTEVVEYIKSLNTCFFVKGNIYYFEGMMKHTLPYDFDKHPKAILIDIYDIEEDKYLFINVIQEISKHLGCELAPIIFQGYYKCWNQEIPNSKYGNFQAEGVVIKPFEFSRDSFGNRHVAKIVTEKFKEENKEVFGEINDFESGFAHKFCNQARINKHIKQLENAKNDTVKPGWIPILSYNVCYDICTEEFKKLLKKQNPNLQTIRKECERLIKLQLSQEGIL